MKRMEWTAGIAGSLTPLAYDTASTIAAAKGSVLREPRVRTCSSRFRDRESIPANRRGYFAGIPINVTLLFSREPILPLPTQFLRGIERRIEVDSIPMWAPSLGVRQPLGHCGSGEQCLTSCAITRESPLRNERTRHTWLF
jgi:hypothetical protein